MTLANLGYILLGIWLIAAGVVPLSGAHLPHATTAMALLAIASGVLILLGIWNRPRQWFS
jgi:hypothetical membrane protein